MNNPKFIKATVHVKGENNMFRLEYVETILKSIDILKELLNSNISNYIANYVPVQDAILIRENLVSARQNLYNMIPRYDDPDVHKIFKSMYEYNFIEFEIQDKISLATCMISMLDRYIAEYYVTKLEESRAGSSIIGVKVELEYATSFRDLKKDDKGDKEK